MTAAAMAGLEDWRIVIDVVNDAGAHALLIPANDDPADCRQSLEIAVTPAGGDIDLMTLVQHAKTAVLAGAGDAADTFAFEVLAREPARAMHAWRLAGHCLLEDQVSVTSFARSRGGIVATTCAARGEESDDRLEAGVRLVAALSPDWWPTPRRNAGACPTASSKKPIGNASSPSCPRRRRCSEAATPAAAGRRRSAACNAPPSPRCGPSRTRCSR